MELGLTPFAAIGFVLAAYSVIGNDAVQTLGTFMASNRKIAWQWQWLAASLVLIATVAGGWYVFGGDISYGRLEKIPAIDVQWYHAAAPAVLLVLTRIGIPVSTSLLVLSAFASALVFEKILLKSVLGYSVAAVVAYVLWFLVAKVTSGSVDPKNAQKWRVFQWFSTGFLWYTWLSHDMANIAVFLPRELSVSLLLFVLTVLVAGLAYIFWSKGGKIQKIVIEKTDTEYVRAATIVDLVYAFILLFFKELNSIPMSTTWVFVGLLAGRELAISTVMKNNYKHVFPLIGKDILKMFVGLAVSILLVLGVQYLSGN